MKHMKVPGSIWAWASVNKWHEWAMLSIHSFAQSWFSGFYNIFHDFWNVCQTYVPSRVNHRLHILSVVAPSCSSLHVHSMCPTNTDATCSLWTQKTLGTTQHDCLQRNKVKQIHIFSMFLFVHQSYPQEHRGNTSVISNSINNSEIKNIQVTFK